MFRCSQNVSFRVFTHVFQAIKLSSLSRWQLQQWQLSHNSRTWIQKLLVRIKVRIQPFSAAVTRVESSDPQVILQGTVSNSLCFEFLLDHWRLDSHQVPGEEFWCQRWKLRIEQMQILDQRLNDRWQNAERAILRSDKCTWNKSENSLKLKILQNCLN